MSSDLGSSDPVGQGGPDANPRAGDPTPEERAAAAELLRMISGTHISRAVYLLAELGIPDLLADGPRTTVELSQATNTHEGSLYRVLRLLASLGVLSEQPGTRFGLTVLGERLRSGVPASMRSWARLVDQAGAFPAFEPIIETVRTGRPGFEIARGMPFFEYLSHDPQRAAGFQAAMSERTAAFASSVATTCGFSQMRAIVDVGGGAGTLLAAILRANDHLRGVLFDLPKMTAEAQATLEAAGVADRCKVAAGDFFRGVPEGADAYLLANVLHDWDDARAVQILGACRRAMHDDGRILIIERLIADDPVQALPVLLSDMMMLVVPGGQERTNSHYGRLLTEAGLRMGGVQPVAAPYGVIEGLP